MNASHKFPWSFLAITFGFTWLILSPGVLAYFGLFKLPFPALALAAFAQFAPSLAAFLLSGLHEGKAGMGKLLKRALDFHFSILWLAIVILIPLAVGAAALGLYVLTTGQIPALGMLSQPIMILPSLLMIFFLQGPVPEEFGWRGYLLDRFQARWSPLVASLVMGVIWAVWHLPSWFMEGTYQSFAPFWAFTIYDIAVTILFTWIYNHTRGNLFLALLFHAMIDLANVIFLSAGEVGGGNTLAFLFMTAFYALTAIVVLVARPQQLLIKISKPNAQLY
jgi:uncharacterized protein